MLNLHYFFFSFYFTNLMLYISDRLINGAVSSVGRASRLHREGHRFESFTAHQWGCSSVWLERLPVTQEVAGSSPVTPATIDNRFQLNN